MATIYDQTITVCPDCGEIFYQKEVICEVCGSNLLGGKEPLAKVEVLSGPMDGLEFTVEKQICYIGRDQEKDIPLPLDLRVSRDHACLTFKDDHFSIEDLGSRNGTFVEGKKIKSKVVIPFGSTFKTGRTLMILKKVE